MKHVWMAVLMAATLFGGEVMWETSYAAGSAKAKTEGKPMLLFMNKPGCGACAYMKENVFSDPQVVEYLNTRYVPVSLDVTRNDAPEALKVKMTPVFHFVRADGSLIQPTLVGGKTAPFFLKLLKKADESK